MHPERTRWLALLLALLLLPLPASGAGVKRGDLTFTVEPEPKEEAGHGYAEYVVTVSNGSAEQAHEVTLTLPRDNYRAYGDYLQEVARTARVAPGATVRFSLLQPHRPPLFGFGIGVSIDGRQQERFLDLKVQSPRPYVSYGRGYGTPAATPLVLLSRGVPEAFKTAAARGTAFAPPAPAAPVPMATGPGVRRPAPPTKDKKVGPPRTGPVGPPMTPGPAFRATLAPAGARLLRAEADIGAWTGGWLAYSRYDGVVVTGDELGRAPAAVRTALWQYAETGGTLVVLGEAKVPPGWKRRPDSAPDYRAYDAGFGLAVVADGPYRSWPKKRWDELRDGLARAFAPWQRVRSVGEANDDFPVVDNVGVPVRGLFVLMLLFAVAIGPVNMGLLARKGRRLWLLWTVPAISLLTCALVFGYMLASEGWHGHRRVLALTLLDGPSRRATTIGWAGFYTPLTPGDGLHFGYDTELAAQNAQDYRYGRVGGVAHVLDWSQDQHLARGWVTPRVPAYFMLRKSEVRRERVTVTRADAGGALTVVNGLGAALRRFWYADGQGRLHTAEEVLPGASAALTPTEQKARPDAGDLGPVFRGDWLTTLPQLTEHPERHLAPGWFLAELESAPFVEEGLRGARAERCRSVVVGALEGPGDAR